MSRPSVEQRIAALEQQVAQIKAQQANGVPKKDWRGTVGKFPGMQEIFAEAMKLREADRQKARRQPRRASRVKS
jgi:hypothetical protein